MNPNQKMSFYDFIMENNKKYDMDDDDWGPFTNRKCAVIRFDYDSKGNVSGEYKGITVYRDKSFERTILPGDTWICSLKPNPNLKSNFFAKPLERVDASFVFSLMEEQRDVIIDSMWSDHKEEMMPMLEEKFKAVIDERVKAAEEKITKEDKRMIDDLEEKNAQQSMELAENERIIESMQTQINTLKAENEELKDESTRNKKKEANKSDKVTGFMEYAPPKYTVMRVGADSIQSDLFTKPRYFVHLSPDQRIMVSRPSDKGNVICVDNTIELAGLSFISDFVEEGEMVSQYDPKAGGIQIRLK